MYELCLQLPLIFILGYSIILQFPLAQPVKLLRGIFWSNFSSLYQKSLYNAHITTSKLCESVRAKRAELQWLRQNLKLISILKEQMACLEELALIDQDYSCSLSGAVEALQASTLRLPIVDGGRADVQNLKDAICSAVDVMQAMGSSICLLISKVGEVNSLVVELEKLTQKERNWLYQCKDLLSTIAALQVRESSLRTHTLQLNRVPSSPTTQV
ncbi:hypothetical protein OIU76_007451 [Salix suchowensis]|nr:hypothetical protein OIU76_007451 [Salix suchowensis]